MMPTCSLWPRLGAVLSTVIAIGLAGCNTHADPEARTDLRPAARTGPSSAILAKVDAHAANAGVPRTIAHRVVAQESGYQPHVRGRAGEWGLGQIKCRTAREMGFTGPCVRLADPDVNLRYSMRYLRAALDRGGSSCAGVSLYNRGIHARPQCTGYGHTVLASYR